MFQLGRRGGGLRSLDELNHPVVAMRLREAKSRVEAEVPGGVPEYLNLIKKQFV
jgi:hypothetical protein